MGYLGPHPTEFGNPQSLEFPHIVPLPGPSQGADGVSLQDAPTERFPGAGAFFPSPLEMLHPQPITETARHGTALPSTDHPQDTTSTAQPERQPQAGGRQGQGRGAQAWGRGS